MRILTAKEETILAYCKPHLEMMWAATIVSVLLDCDFRECENGIKAYHEFKAGFESGNEKLKGC